MNWKREKLGDVVDVISGTTPSSTEKRFWRGRYTWITPTDLGKLNSIYINSSDRKVTQEGIENANLPLVPKNSVVISSRAPIGHIGIADTDLYTNQGCKSFSCYERIEPLYLYYYLKFRMNDIQKLGSGSTFSEVSKTQLENFYVSFPESIEEQKKIASKLYSQLTVIEKAREAIEGQLRELNQLKIKLQEKSMNILKDIPRLPLEHFLQVIEAGKSIKTTELPAKKDELGVLKVSAVSWDKFQPDEAKATKSTYEPKESHRVKKGDLIISRANTIELVGAIVFVEQDYPNRLLSDKTLRLVINEKTGVDPEYLLQILKLPEARNHIEGNATGTSDSMRNISQKTINKIPIPDADADKQMEVIKLFKDTSEFALRAEESLRCMLEESKLLPSKLLNEAFELKNGKSEN